MFLKKKLLILVVITLFVLTCLSGCTDKGTNGKKEKISFVTYTNEEKGIRIEYPETWQKQENPTYAANVDVLFTSPYNEDPKDAGTLLVSVLVNDSLIKGIDWFKQAHVENLTKALDNFTLISEKNTTLSGESGYHINFTFSQNDQEWCQTETFTINNDTLYLLMYQVKTNRYSIYIDLINQMIESFRMVDADSVNNEENKKDDAAISDFETLIGSWKTNDTDAIFKTVSFYSNGTTISTEGEGTFELLSTDKQLIVDYQSSQGGKYTFNYSFSNDGNTLVLTDINMPGSATYKRQVSKEQVDDKENRFVGSWIRDKKIAITFNEDGTYVSGDIGFFEYNNSKLTLFHQNGTVNDVFEYSFSDDNKTLILTNIATDETVALTKQ
ncbi:MAG: PsbP-related protein [Candidatus Thermoplasmatota archaeon]